MRPSKKLQKLLANFVFRDCRLESHPKVAAVKVFLAAGPSHLELAAAVSKHPIGFEDQRIEIGRSLTAHAWAKREAVVAPLHSEGGTPKAEFFKTVKSGVFIPIGDTSETFGVLSLHATEDRFFREGDIGRLQLLCALIAFIERPGRTKAIDNQAATSLGRAMRDVRTELGLTQEEIAHRGGLNRIALSQWERGRWPPSMGPIYQWCAALGLVSEEDEPQVSYFDVTPQLIDLLRDNPVELHNLSPERFEHLIAQRFDRMGYDVQLTGATTRRDGGIDLIAVPKIKTVGSFLMAVQVKHHRTDRPTGRAEVDRMLAWKDSPFRVGVMVTNTTFSQDAKWLADQVNHRALLRLRDFEDLKRWLRDQFDSEFDWREIPDVISLAPGISVPVPKGRLVNARGIWPLAAIKMMDNYPEDE